MQDVRFAALAVEPPSAQHLKEAGTQRPKVVLRCDRVLHDRLGGHVMGLSLQAVPGLGEAGHVRHPKVSQLHLSLVGDEHVGRAHVAMDDPQRLSGVAGQVHIVEGT